MSENEFGAATADKFPTFHAKIHWLPTMHTVSPVAGSCVLRQRVWLGPREDHTQSRVNTAGGVQLAATCVFGDETDESQEVELSFWSSIDLASLAGPGTDLALLEDTQVVATGKIL